MITVMLFFSLTFNEEIKNLEGFCNTHVLYIPNIYIIVKQLSKAKPTKNRHSANSQKLPASTVATPAKNPVTLAPTNAGILPYLSAIHPKIRPPKIAPTKKTLWAVVGSALCSHTQPNCNRDLGSNNLFLGSTRAR